MRGRHRCADVGVRSPRLGLIGCTQGDPKNVSTGGRRCPRLSLPRRSRPGQEPRAVQDSWLKSGEGGIRTCDPPFSRYAISSRVTRPQTKPAATQPATEPDQSASPGDRSSSPAARQRRPPLGMQDGHDRRRGTLRTTPTRATPKHQRTPADESGHFLCCAKAFIHSSLCPMLARECPGPRGSRTATRASQRAAEAVEESVELSYRER